MNDPIMNEPIIPPELRPLVLCVTCGVPWAEHTAECSRHAYRPQPEQKKEDTCDPSTQATG